MLRSYSVLIFVVFISNFLNAHQLHLSEMRVKLGDTNIKVVSWGSGETIVLLHGGSGPVPSFGGLAPKLAERGFRVLMVNRRGFAGSTGPLTDLTLHDYASDLASVTNDLVGGPVHVLGHAYGNRVARCFAADYPKLTKSVILLAAGGEVTGEEAAWAALRRMSEPNISRIEKVKLARASLFSPKTAASVILKYLDSRRGSKDGQAAARAANRKTMLEDWWGAGSSQMLVIQGLDDLIAPKENGRDLLNKLAGRVTLAELENAGHAIIVEQTDKLAEIISGFVNSSER